MPLNTVLALIASIAPSASMSAPVTNKPVRVDERGIGDQRLASAKPAILGIARGRKGVAGTMADTLGTLAVWGANLGNPLSGTPLGNAYPSQPTPTMAMFAGDGATVAFQTDIPYAAFSNYNWIVETWARKLVGTFTVAAGVITGSSTTLNTAGVNILPGDVLNIGGLNVTVVSVASDTSAVVTPAIDATAGSIGYQLSQRDRIKKYNASPTLSTEYGVTNVGGFALITFGVAPPTEKVGGVAIFGALGAQGPGIAVHLVTPVQILADGAHADERVGVKSKTCMWVVTTGDGGDDFDAAVVTLEPSGT